MRAVVAGTISFQASECPPKVLELLRKELSFPNPEHVARKRLGRYAGNIPETIECLVEHPDGWVEIPRGAVGILRQHASSLNMPLFFDDQRVLRPALDACVHIDLRPYQRKAVRSMRSGVQGSVVVPCGGGKCVARDSLVFTDRGLLTADELASGVPVKQVAFGEVEVDTSTGSALTNAVYNGGPSETRKIHLHLGYTLEATPEHPVKVLQNGELAWKRADQLAKGDHVMVRRGSDAWDAFDDSRKSPSFTEDLVLDELTAEVCGLLLAAGEDVPDDHAAISHWETAHGATVQSAIVREYLRWVGLDFTCKTHQHIPKRIRHSGRPIMTAFLRGLFDGGATYDPTRCNIDLYSDSERLLKEVQVALLGFGLVCSIIPRLLSEKSRLSVHDVPGFMRKIGSSSEVITERLRHVGMRSQTRLNQDTLPVNDLVGKLHEAARRAPSWTARDARHFSKSLPVKRPPSRTLLLRLVKRWESECPRECAPISTLLTLPAMFLPVQRIEKSRAAVVDLCVPEAHEFVAGGVVCHNTVIGAAAIARTGQPSLVIVHTQDLLDQWIEAFGRILHIEPGIIAEGKSAPGPITVATIQTLALQSDLDELCTRFGCVMVDETHRCPASSFQSVLSRMPARYRYGLTATPFREDGLTRLIDLTLGERLYEVEHWELVLCGYLFTPEVREINTGFEFDYTGPRDYQRCLTALVNDDARNGLIADISSEQARNGRSVLVLSGRVEHCRRLAMLIRERGASAEVLVGAVKKSERRQILDDFRSGKVRVVVASTLADEGLDVPRLDRIVLAFPSRAKGRTIQRLGRLMRPHPDKQKAVLFDLVDRNVPPLYRQYQERKRLYKSLDLAKRSEP